MGNESGEWIMHGMNWDNPDCIHSVDEAIKYINEFGFLPLFKNDIDGFSLEERTVPEYWWSDNPVVDPWMWRAIIARRHDIVYGKFFDKKAGFISKKWLPVFANYRRDGYDFDALYDDGKAPNKHKKIMVNFMEDNADSEIYSNELKKQAGFGKDGEKGFDGAITNLMMQTYLCNCDFKKRVNKRGIEYGWDEEYKDLLLERKEILRSNGFINKLQPRFEAICERLQEIDNETQKKLWGEVVLKDSEDEDIDFSFRDTSENVFQRKTGGWRMDFS